MTNKQASPQECDPSFGNAISPRQDAAMVPKQYKVAGRLSATFMVVLSISIPIALARNTNLRRIPPPADPTLTHRAAVNSAYQALTPVTGLKTTLQTLVPVATKRVRKTNVLQEMALLRKTHPAPPAPAQPVIQPTHAVGVYLTASSVRTDGYVDGTIDSVVGAGGNAFVFDVKGSSVYFDADAPMARELGLISAQYDLAEILALAKEKGVYTIARYIAVKDPNLTSRKPELLPISPKTGRIIGGTFVDPENEVALQYNREILCELAKSGVDEINLDYIRFSTELPIALSVFSMEEKSRKVAVYVQMARDTIDTCGPGTKLGISTYAILGWSYEINLANLGQDIVNLAPIVDIISPMAYPATFAEGAYYTPGVSPISRMYYLVWRTLDGYKKLAGDQYAWKIRPWIQGYSVNKQNMIDEMKAVHDAGLCGFTVWNASNSYSVTYSAMPSFERPIECGPTNVVTTQ